MYFTELIVCINYGSSKICRVIRILIFDQFDQYLIKFKFSWVNKNKWTINYLILLYI